MARPSNALGAGVMRIFQQARGEAFLLGRGLRRPARRGSGGPRPRSGPWRRSRPPPARNRPGRFPRCARASITRWSRPSNRPQSRIAPGPAARARTRAWVSGSAARRKIDQRPAVPRHRIDRRRRHIGPHHHAGPAAGRACRPRCDACPGRDRGCRAPPATRDFSASALPSSETPSGPGNISGKQREDGGGPATRHWVQCPRLRRLPAPRTHECARPAISITGTVSRVKASSTLSPSGRAISITSPAPKLWMAATLPSTPAFAVLRLPGRSGRRDRIRLRPVAGSAARATNSSVPFSASAALRSSTPGNEITASPGFAAGERR